MSLQLSPAQAAQIILDRRAARANLISFTEFTFPQYRTAAHHKRVAHELELVLQGETDRLMLLMPPRHGKSELASKRFQSWALGRDPRLHLLGVSATANLATDFGREVRNTISSESYRALFDTQLAEDSQSKGKWHTKAGGVYYSVGVGGALLGRGANIMTIDDPYATMEDAQSETIRRKVWDWYTGTAYNRLQPGGAIVLINHRMHEDDLTGALLEQQTAGGDQWKVVELPAIDEDGAALWPEAYPIEALERIKRNTLPRFWSALYQQSPAPDDGTYFKREWFNWYNTKPQHLRTYGASDYAVTEDGGDYTVHIVVGIDPDDDVYVLDVWRRQTESDIWIDAFLDMVKLHKPLCWGEEKGQIIKSLGPFIDKRMRERKIYCRREAVTSAADKPTRSRSFQARAAMGKVYLPHDAPWMPDLLAEMLQFPAGKHDDQVDTLGLIGRMLDTMVGGRIPKQKTTTVDRWDKAFNQPQDDGPYNWKTA